MFEYLHENLSEEDFENVFRYNARRLFNLWHQEIL
jgi:predicted TIM-barrel fold metal-dependent hydrolase